MTKAIRIHETGGPEVFKWEDVDVGKPGAGQVRIKHTAVGLNFIDIYLRSGMYPLPNMPAIIGMEAAGVVEEVGAEVSDLKEGDRVAYATQPPGAYCEARVIQADRLVKIPDGINDQTAAAMMLQGMTASFLLRKTYEVQKGDTILFHAAAGGVGLIACQWAKALGATVIGTVGSEEKAELARAHGCDHPVLYKTENFTDKVKELTGGAGVPVAYDSVGKDTWEGSLASLRPRGLLAIFGSASGPTGPIDPGLLAAGGSLYLTRPTLFTYCASRDELLDLTNSLFEVIKSGAVKIEVNQTYPLKDVAQAHADLAGRKTTGSTVLLP